MRYHVLATDYDGTLAQNGRVDVATVESLRQLLATGRRLVMVTGRELPELLDIFPEIDLFEWVVAENGGLLYRPSAKEEKLLAESPSDSFLQALGKKNVGPLSVGRVVVATWEPHQDSVINTIHDQGLELQVIFNKGAVMILPAGINKASGLIAALKEMGISPHNVVGIGDAENDHAFLRLCEMSVAVANALPAVKETADFITAGDHSQGVCQLIEELVANDLTALNLQQQRHHLVLGTSDDQEVLLSPYGQSVLICGPSASGKSTVATRIVESLQEQQYQFCLIDPEGDYDEFEGAVMFGGPKAAPPEDEILRFLEDPNTNAVVCLTGLPIPDRPPFFLRLLSQLLQMRSRTGRPHWLILDEAHHLMPAEWLPPDGTLPKELTNVVLITVHPDLLSGALLERVDTLLVVGANAHETLTSFTRIIKQPVPQMDSTALEPGEFLLWLKESATPPQKVLGHPCKMVRHRHRRKYAEGQLPPERSFYFRGPQHKMNLRAQNLMLFLQIGDGVDDETWQYHLHQGDFSRWFREAIKDENLASAAERVESLTQATPKESRALIRATVEQDYTVPASLPLPVPGSS
ncbi:HAD hydrolase family protein [uncultured Desulfobulbus sp.]|uniref:HAD hydrolase family protein n=1 Tax=uncultured Desulfobulbus sp. TaxID=239745 RepID=UPI0029C77B4D|nr:HAD hydrolase family protein [uncultured Desulfobulbus sp.]